MTLRDDIEPAHRNAFTDQELERVCAELRRDALHGFLNMWNVLLAKAGQPPYQQHIDHTIRPDDYSIPYEQAKTIVASIEPDNPELHFAWLIAWLQVGPTWHTD
jgi:hypothetical protein